MSVRNSESAEEVAKNFISKKWSWAASDIDVEGVDFDGTFFVVEGAIKKEGTDEIDARFSVKIGKDRSVVGWKMTWTS